MDTRILCEIEDLAMSGRTERLKQRLLAEPRYVSIDQAKLVTESYKLTEGEHKVCRRAKALAHVLHHLPIRIAPDELIVGNRTPTSRAGVVSPEAAIAWVDREIETLPTRPQDRFEVRDQDIRDFRETILPYWRGKTLEDRVYGCLREDIAPIVTVVKINQKDHAQGHIIPNVRKWLAVGPAGLLEQARHFLTCCSEEQRPFYEGVATALSGCLEFLNRYGRLADEMARATDDFGERENLLEISRVCRKLAGQPPGSFREAAQSVWFLFVLLHVESNASSFSPGRLDQYLWPYLDTDLGSGSLTLDAALEILEGLWLKFNGIVYMRGADDARYFAGFPIGFNICIGGQTSERTDATNPLSYLCLKAQEHLGLPQPNLSARLHKNTPQHFLEKSARVIGLGSGMPQVFNDESIIPALMSQGVNISDAIDYAVVGCVELSTQGNYLGWSDAAMFNLVKVLELALNNGRCMLTNAQMGPQTGYLPEFRTYESFEAAFETQMDFFIERMIAACGTVDSIHAEVIPSPFLSSVIDDCLEKGVDVTAGGATYNLSGIQGIQVANVADSLAALKQCVFEDRGVPADHLLDALKKDFAGWEPLRLHLLNHVSKYGNDVEWVDNLGARWARLFAQKVARHRNVRGGKYHTGFYTVSAHVPMGKNVAATPDGRRARTPLADGGLSAVYGRDQKGPTALLHSVSRIDSRLGSNGTLLNMKFLPDFFQTAEDIGKFAALLRGLVRLNIHHAQFNVVRKEDLLKAKENPDAYRHLTIRVAGYTAYFTELAEDLQDEIIARTTFGEPSRCAD